jgi:hypothetical protein
MTAGRCAGCGATGPPRKIRSHVMSCSDYAQLYREHPEQALDPEAEYARWAAGPRAAEQAAAREQAIASAEARRAAQAARFRSREIQEDHIDRHRQEEGSGEAGIRRPAS